MPAAVRPAERADVPAILDIYNWAVVNSTATADYEPRSLKREMAWFDEHARAGLPVLVAVDGQRVVGWSSLSPYHQRVGYRFTLEDSVYVAPDSWQRGIGTALLAPLIDAARGIGCHAIVAVIAGGNEASIRLHARFGFEHAGLLREAIIKFDRWLDVVYMQKLLT